MKSSANASLPDIASKPISQHANPSLSRRRFLGGMIGAASVAPMTARARNASDSSAMEERRIKLGVVGTGGRGAWIAGLFRSHGGFELWSVADYFSDVADRCGATVGVPPERRFSTLSGYQRLIESGVEAVALEAVPYFYPEHVRAAVEAGLHVYLAKPVAVDVPGALEVLALGERATREGRVFLVDYQIPTDALNIEVAERIRTGGLGRIAQIFTKGAGGPLNDPPLTGSIESRLQNLIWVSDAALGCDHIGNYGIHALDAALWVLGRRPIAATGVSRLVRANPHGDSCDVCSALFEYSDGTVHSHFGQSLGNNSPEELSATFHGVDAHALINYWGRAYVRGGEQHFGGGTVENLYEAGAVRNIARFHHEISSGQLTNDTCSRAVDGVLTSLLGQAAGARRTRVTMEQLLHENTRLVVDLRGLKT